MIAVAIAWIVSIVVYPLSIGPALLIAENGQLSSRTVSVVYRPLLWLHWRIPEPIQDACEFYMSMWSDDLSIRVQADHFLWHLGLCQEHEALEGQDFGDY